jgi:hypothetical protein
MIVATMRIEFVREGGVGYFPSLNRPVVIDTNDLEPSTARRLSELLREAGFFKLPSVVDTPAPGAADYQSYTICVYDRGNTHSVRVNDPVRDDRLAILIRLLSSLSGRGPQV